MNEQEEILVRQSKWSGRRIVLFYWFAIVFLGTSAAAGLGTTILLPNYKIEADPHEGITDPWGPEDCDGAGCHDDQIAGWETTWHAQMVGEFDPSNNALNGSRMSYNDTHYWRTPKMPFGVTVNYWTYNQIYNASGQQCCMTTRWTNVTLINATTGELLWNDSTLVDAGWTSNIWDIGVSCAACHDNPGEYDLSYRTCSGCHTPGGRQWMGYVQSDHYGSLDDLLASGDINSLLGDGYWYYVGQSTYMSITALNASDYYTITCATCHDMHDSTVNDGDESNAMSPWRNPYTGEEFGPGGSQLRAATVNALCGTCHDISLNTTAKGYLDPSDHDGLSCTDCHGYTYSPISYFDNGTVEANSSVSSLNHNWNFNFGETGCGVCHDENATTVYNTMLDYQTNFGNLTDMKATYATKLAEATAAYETAKAADGVDMDLLANAYALIEEAKALAAGNSLSFHNPELGAEVEAEQLSLALSKLDDAVDDATDAIPEPEETTTTEEPVETTTTEPVVTTTDDPTTEPTPAIGLLAIMGILGVVALFRRKRR